MGLAPEGWEPPRVGELWALAIGNLNAAAGPAAIWAGVSTTTWNNVPLPIELSMLGLPGCKVFVSVDVPLLVPVVGTTARLAFMIPNTPEMIGASFHWQGYGTGIHGRATTGGLTIVIGTR